MAVITLTSDFGRKDYYLARIKGELASISPVPNVIDISHEIDNFDIAQAGFVLKSAYLSFPKGSIHLVSVFNNLEASEGLMLFSRNNHFFIGPDNGLFTTMFPDLDSPVYCIDCKKNSQISGNNKVMEAIAQLLEGWPIDDIGEMLDKWVIKLPMRPVIVGDQIRGIIVYIDKFGNVITNIDRATFEFYRKGRDFKLFYQRNDPITAISPGYWDVRPGEALCKFNSTNYLEIAVNMGNASEELILNKNEAVQITFV